MTVIRNNSISGINSITAQSTSLNFYDTSGNTLSIGANVTGNLTGTASTATAAATAYDLSGSPTLTGITSVSTTNLTVNGNAYPSSGTLSSRNKLINGNFDVWQRGTSFSSTVSGASDYTADRWKAGGGTSTTVSRQAFTLGQTDVPGEPTYYAQWAITNNSQNYEFQQRIEDVRTLAGKKATISFYARRTTGTITVGVRTVQYFGTGGSPSSSVIVSAGAPSLTSSWQKFTYTVDIASISGKTLGSDNNHSLWVGFQVSDTNTGTIEIAQFQVEEGSVATPFEHRNISDELYRCRRYYQKSYPHNIAPGNVTSGQRAGDFTLLEGGNTTVAIMLRFEPEMRALPTVTTYSFQNANTVNKVTASTTDYTSSTNSAVNSASRYIITATSVTAADDVYCAYTAEAEL